MKADITERGIAMPPAPQAGCLEIEKVRSHPSAKGDRFGRKRDRL